MQCGSISALMATANKFLGLGPEKAQEMLALLHPVLMENLVLGADGCLRPKSDKYEWARRQGWRLKSL